MKSSNLRLRIAEFRRAQDDAFSAEDALRGFCRQHSPAEIVKSVVLQAEFDALTKRLSSKASEFEAHAVQIAATRDFLNDLLRHFLLDEVSSPGGSPEYSDWLHSVDRLMECRARFPALDEATIVGQRRDAALLKEDRAATELYRETRIREAQLFERIANSLIGEDAADDLQTDRSNQSREKSRLT